VGKGGHLSKFGEGGAIPNLPSTYSAHDFHTYAGLNALPPVIHFHLAGSINAETDIPLVPSLKGSANGNNNTQDGKAEPNFVVHFLNNKELYFTTESETILLDLGRRAMEEELGKQPQSKSEPQQSDTDSTEGVDSEVANSVQSSPTSKSRALYVFY
jgi:hypothetical protein